MEFRHSYGAEWMQNDSINELKVQVVDRAGVTDKRMTTRICKYPWCCNSLEGHLSELWVWMALGDGKKRKWFFCQCSSYFWKLPCVYPCLRPINESHNFTLDTFTRMGCFYCLFIYQTVLIHCESEHCVRWAWISGSNARTTKYFKTIWSWPCICQVLLFG